MNNLFSGIVNWLGARSAQESNQEQRVEQFAQDLQSMCIEQSLANKGKEGLVNFVRKYKAEHEIFDKEDFKRALEEFAGEESVSEVSIAWLSDVVANFYQN